MQCFAKRAMEPAKPLEIVVAQQLHDARLLLERRGNFNKKITARSQRRQTCFDVVADRVQLQRRQQPAIERRFGEGAQQRGPVILRPERMIRHRIVVVVPAISELALESQHGFVGPRPVAQKTREAID